VEAAFAGPVRSCDGIEQRVRSNGASCRFGQFQPNAKVEDSGAPQQSDPREKTETMTQPRQRSKLVYCFNSHCRISLGPAVFSWFANIHLVWKTKDLVCVSITALGFSRPRAFRPPRELKILFAPGRLGQPEVMKDAPVLALLAELI
jgi:hypothetical protein